MQTKVCKKVRILKESIIGLAVAAINSAFGRLINSPAAVCPGRLIDSAFDPGLMTSNGCVPLRMPPIGAKLYQNAFQTIPDVSFFSTEKLFFEKIANFDGPFTPLGCLRFT